MPDSIAAKRKPTEAPGYVNTVAPGQPRRPKRGAVGTSRKHAVEDARRPDEPALHTGVLELALLGPWEVRVDGTEVDDARWTRRAARTLLKMLALEPGQRAHRERLMDLLWPGTGTDSAANGLHKAIHAARRALEPGLESRASSRFLLTSPSEVWLGAPTKLWIDVDAFAARVERAIETKTREAHRIAKDLYRGELLPEDLYAEWAQRPRERTRVHYVDLLKSYAHALEATGDLRSAIRELAELLRLEPADEDAHRHLIHLYAKSGAREQAYLQFKRCRSALREHLGVGPDRTTIELYERILSGAGPRTTTGAFVVSAETRGPAMPAASPPRRGPAEVPHNLPRHVTRFVGRESQLREAQQLLKRAPVLTVAGPAGMGKTRFALELAAGALAEFDDGVYLVELGSLPDGGLLASAVAGVLGVREEPGREIAESLLDFVSTRRLLLVLDGSEHVIEACAALVGALLRRSERVSVLLTSREPLDAPGEVVWRLGALSMPAGAPATAREALEAESVRLLTDRARQIDPTFELADAAAGVIAELCQRLEGIPLAIELVAARLAVLSPAQLLERLDGPLRLLDIETRGGNQRHRSLRAALDWSYSLCSDVERLALRRFSSFAGTWGLSAAEALCGEIASANDSVIEVLARLVRKSLVIAHGDGPEVRYGMLRAVRLYARQRLDESGELDETLRRRAAWYRGTAVRAERELKGPDQVRWLEALDRERDNLHAVLTDPRLDAEPGGVARVAVALMRFWTVRGHWSEGLAILEGALERLDPLDPSDLRARTTYSAATLRRLRADFPGALRLLERSLADWRSLGDDAGVALTLYQMSTVLLSMRESAAAEPLAREAYEIYSVVNDAFGRALVQIQLGNIAAERNELGAARAHLVDGLAYFRDAGDKLNIGIVLHSLGEVAYQGGDLEEAEAFFGESMAASERVDYVLLRSLSAVARAYIALERGAVDRSAKFLALALETALEVNDLETLFQVAEGVAAATIGRGDLRFGMLVWEVSSRSRSELGVGRNEIYSRALEPALQRGEREMSSRELAQVRTQAVTVAVEGLWRELERYLCDWTAGARALGDGR